MRDRQLTMGQVAVKGVLRWVGWLVLAGALTVSLAACATDSLDGPIEASGFIEGEEVVIVPQVSGRIAEMVVQRGDQVQQGDVLVQLDDAALQSQRLEAQAGLAAARANLDHVRAGARAEEIAAAQAALNQAQADLDGARQAVLNAREVLSAPLSLDAEITAARTQVDLAQQKVELARADLQETELRVGPHRDQDGNLDEKWALQLQAAQAALDQAEAELSGARRYLTALVDMRHNPLSLEMQLHNAETQYELAQAQLASAQAMLDELQAGPTADEIAIAEAQVRQAEAAVRLVDARLDQLTLTAPMDGFVTSRSAQTGETAMAGTPLLTIANLDVVTLVIYVPENRIGQVGLGQQVAVTVDAFPGEVFSGHVSSIAGEAEFTPRNVQTQEERVNLVFAVKVRIPNPTDERGGYPLKPGMPADATLRR